MGADALLNRLIKYFLILSFGASCASKPVYIDYDNMDYGLPETPDKEEFFDVEADGGDIYGVSHLATYFIDINNDGKKDKIIRGYFSVISAHGYAFYKIYLHNGEKIAEFRTVEAAECFLTAYKFQFEPFLLTKVSRPLGEESWIQPTPGKIEKYKIIKNRMEKVSEEPGPILCDVRTLL